MNHCLFLAAIAAALPTLAQTTAPPVITTITNTTTATSSAGGACWIANKTPGSGSFSWACGPSPNQPSDQSGNFAAVANAEQVVLWIENDLLCLVFVNTTGAAWAVLPNAANVPSLTVPANQVGLSCLSKSAGASAPPANTTIQ